jgi:FkbM family methyltransferase
MRQKFRRFDCFEPYPPSAEYAAAVFPGVGIHQIAVSYQNGTVELALPPGEQTETGQLVTPGTPDMEWSVKDWDKVPRVTVPCRTADALAEEFGYPDFVKVDTEGHEMHVLAGAQKVMERGADFLIEVHSQANFVWLEKELADWAYRVEVIRHPHYEEGTQLWKSHGWLKAFAPGRA